MPVTGSVQVTQPESQSEWKPLPEGTYQVVLKDIEERDVQKFNAPSGELESKFLFKMVVLDEGEHSGKTITSFIMPRWFGGSDGKKKAYSPSKLVTFFKAVYAFYYPKLNVKELSTPDEAMINDLIGKQIIIVVKLNDDKNGNKISDYLSIKTEVDIPEDVKLNKAIKKVAKSKADEEVEQITSEDAGEDKTLPF